MFCLRQLHCQCLVYALPLLRLLVSTAPLRYYCQQLHKLDCLVNIVPPPILPYLLAVSLRLGRFSGHTTSEKFLRRPLEFSLRGF
jgi:hypothetical protein